MHIEIYNLPKIPYPHIGTSDIRIAIHSRKTTLKRLIGTHNPECQCHTTAYRINYSDCCDSNQSIIKLKLELKILENIYKSKGIK